jgi:hypothetical protein
VGVKSLGVRRFISRQLMQVIGDNQVEIVPEVQTNGSGTGAGGAIKQPHVGSATGNHARGMNTPGGWLKQKRNGQAAPAEAPLLRN